MRLRNLLLAAILAGGLHPPAWAADVTGSPQPVNAGLVAASIAAWTSATASDTTVSVAIKSYATVALSFNPSGTITAGTLNFEVSDDGGTTWYAINGLRTDSQSAESTYALTSGKRAWQFITSGYTNFRARLNPAITGSGTANLRAQATAAPLGFATPPNCTTAPNLVCNTRLLNTTSPLAGGGDLSADRTLSITADGIGPNQVDETAAYAFSNQLLSTGALTCGSGTAGKLRVHTTPLQYCDNAGTPTLRYSAYSNSAGDPTGSHGALSNLSADDHTQYVLLNGRSGGQTIKGDTASGGNLTLMSTSHATKGKVLFGASAYDEVNDRLGIGTTTPAGEIEAVRSAASARIYSTSYGGGFNWPTFLGRGAGGTAASPSASASGNLLALFGGAGYDGSAFQNASQIWMAASEAWSGTARGSHIRLYSIANGTTTAVERCRVDQDGSFLCGRSSKFQVDDNGNIIKLNNVTTSFPSADGNNGQVLTAGGNNTSSWSRPWVATAGGCKTLGTVTASRWWSVNGGWSSAGLQSCETTTEANTAEPVPNALTVRAMACGIDTDPGNGNTRVFKLRSSAADVTSMSCTITGTSGGTAKSCNVNNAAGTAIAAGATWNFQEAGTGTPAATNPECALYYTVDAF